MPAPISRTKDAFVHTCTHVTYIYTHKYIYIHIYIYTYIYIRICMHVCRRSVSVPSPARAKNQDAGLSVFVGEDEEAPADEWFKRSPSAVRERERERERVWDREREKDREK